MTRKGVQSNCCLRENPITPLLGRQGGEIHFHNQLLVHTAEHAYNHGPMQHQVDDTEARRDRIAEHIRAILRELGEDPSREGLRETPLRVAKAMLHLTRGAGQTPASVVNGALFACASDDMVLLRDIEVYSLCEHHLLPFYGKCHVAYIGRGQVLGVSKVARIVDCLAARLQIQERLTAEIARAVRESVNAEGVGVVMECRHLCMMMRGVEKQNSVMVTSSVLGSFRSNPSTRAEFMNLVQPSRTR